jgi:protein transport protein SEC13
MQKVSMNLTFRHEGPVWQVSWSHPMFGNYLASCSYDKKVIVWKEMNNNKWSPFYEYSGHESSGKQYRINIK